LAYSVLVAVEPAEKFGSRQIVYFAVCFIAGLVGGFLATCLYKLGLALMGAAIGYIVALLILSLKNGSLIESSTGRTIFIIVFAIVGALLMLVIQRHLVIIGTSLSGSYLMLAGIDVFVKTGFADNVQISSAAKQLVTSDTSSAVYGMIVSMFVIAIIGIVVQYRVTSKGRK
jgi:hypothetical protein